MKKIILLLFLWGCQTVKGQVFDIAKGQNILTTEISLQSAKKIVADKYDFLLTGDTSYSGNVTWAFESKDVNKYELVFLFSTVFNQVTYIQFFDDLKQAANYKNIIQKMGYSSQGIRYSDGGTIAKYGYRKKNLLFIIELGAERGKCKIHFSKVQN